MTDLKKISLLTRGSLILGPTAYPHQRVAYLPLGSWASKMLERDAETSAGDTDPSPTGKEPKAKGGGESGPARG